MPGLGPSWWRGREGRSWCKRGGAWKVCSTAMSPLGSRWEEVGKRSSCSISSFPSCPGFSSSNSLFSFLSCSYSNSLLTPTAPSRLFTTGKVMTLLSVILVGLMWISTVVGAVGIMRTGGRWEMHL